MDNQLSYVQDDANRLYNVCPACTHLRLPFEVTVTLYLSEEKENLVRLQTFHLFYSQDNYIASASLISIRVKLPKGLKMKASKYSVIIALTKELNALVIHCGPSPILPTMRY